MKDLFLYKMFSPSEANNNLKTMHDADNNKSMIPVLLIENSLNMFLAGDI